LPVVETASIPAVARLRPERYEWRQATNREFAIYFGRRKVLGFILPLIGRWQAIIVTNKVGEVAHWHKKGIF
jgi:hypothetical protein